MNRNVVKVISIILAVLMAGGAFGGLLTLFLH